MNAITQRWIAVVIGVALLAAAGGITSRATARGPALWRVGPAAAGGERHVLYWYNPMHPEQHFDQPGRSPYMDMPLQPRYADAGAAAAGGEGTAALRIDPRGDFRTSRCATRPSSADPGRRASMPWAASSSISGASPSSRRGRVVSWTSVHARAPGEVLPRGAAIVDLLVPDWAGAQAEFVALLDSGDPRSSMRRVRASRCSACHRS